jgi:hypothetical protein
MLNRNVAAALSELSNRKNKSGANHARSHGAQQARCFQTFSKCRASVAPDRKAQL